MREQNIVPPAKKARLDPVITVSASTPSAPELLHTSSSSSAQENTAFQELNHSGLLIQLFDKGFAERWHWLPKNSREGGGAFFEAGGRYQATNLSTRLKEYSEGMGFIDKIKVSEKGGRSRCRVRVKKILIL